MLTIDATALNRLNAKLVDYQKVYQRLTIPEVVEKKGTDLRLQCWKLFWENKFGGKGRKKYGIAFAELKRRGKARIGTYVRERSLLSNWGAPPDVTAGRKRKGTKLSTWQKLVWQETTRRQSGVGVLAVGFLSKKFQRGWKNPTIFKEANLSKTLGKLVEIDFGITLTGASYTISGFTPYLADLANKHNIANRAIAEVEKDMDKYLNRKFEEAKQKAFGV
jgi:hypothetical protein